MTEDHQRPDDQLDADVCIHVNAPCKWSIVDDLVHVRLNGENGALLIITPDAACYLAEQLWQASAEAPPDMASSAGGPEVAQT